MPVTPPLVHWLTNTHTDGCAGAVDGNCCVWVHQDECLHDRTDNECLRESP